MLSWYALFNLKWLFSDSTSLKKCENVWNSVKPSSFYKNIIFLTLTKLFQMNNLKFLIHYLSLMHDELNIVSILQVEMDLMLISWLLAVSVARQLVENGRSVTSSYPGLPRNGWKTGNYFENIQLYWTGSLTWLIRLSRYLIINSKKVQKAIY